MDGIDGTADDLVFTDLPAVQQALVLSPAQFEQLAPLVTLNDPTLEIRSIGHSGDTTRTIAVVARKGRRQTPSPFLERMKRTNDAWYCLTPQAEGWAVWRDGQRLHIARDSERSPEFAATGKARSILPCRAIR
ncbi:MAG: hypothetical protein WDN28_33395 [Chthoniobacter sp.]